MSDPAIRIRGIYATALTHVFNASDIAVVDPSTPICERIEESFPERPPTNTINTTSDSAGIRIDGDGEQLAGITAHLESIGIDTFEFDSAFPRDAIVRGKVTRLTDAGAFVTVGENEAFLPQGRMAEPVDRHDQVIVTVHEPVAPWIPGKRPVLASTPRIHGAYADLVYGEEHIRGPSDALIRTVDTLIDEWPAQWGVRIHRPAETVSLPTLRASLQNQIATARSIESTIESSEPAGDLGTIVAPSATTWYRFGRESKFSLDEHRRAVCPTVDGHHRLKAVGEVPRTSVNYLETIGAVDASFSPEAVIETFGPSADRSVEIWHGKPTGETVILGTGTISNTSVTDGITIDRELTAGGRYDALDVPIESGDIAQTTVVEGRWWYPTVYRDSDGNRKGTYVNISTPVEIHPDQIRYIDLYIDVIKTADGTVSIVDEDELNAAIAAGHLSDEIGSRARTIAKSVKKAL